MRLLHVDTLQLQEFYDDAIPDYAILSHTWDLEEVTLQDLQSGRYEEMAGFPKIRACCSVAMSHGYEYVWIDTCW